MKNRKARKSIIVALLLVALIFVVSLGSKSFAKYVTKKNVDAQSAQVAKWGVQITVADTDKLFGDAYKGNVVVANTTDGLEVKAGSKAVAPGTTGYFTFSLSGTPEVANKVTFKFGDTFTEINDGSYYPIKWTLKKGTETLKEGKLSEIKAYLEGDSASVENKAGEALTATYTLSWEWEFGTESSNHDVEDTILGNAIAGVFEEGKTKNDYTLEVKFSLTINVEQIQK